MKQQRLTRRRRKPRRWISTTDAGPGPRLGRAFRDGGDGGAEGGDEGVAQPVLAVAGSGGEPLPMARRWRAGVIEDGGASPAAAARSLPPPCLRSLLEKLSFRGVIQSLCMTQNQEWVSFLRFRRWSKSKAKNLLHCGHMCRIFVDGYLAEVAQDPNRSVYNLFSLAETMAFVLKLLV